jgi:hypothetical protein
MKTNILKTGLFAAAMTLCTAGVFAQPTLPGDYVKFATAGERESIDSVTVGSRMAYRMAGDPVIANMPAAVMNPSIFKWNFSQSVTIKSLDGSQTLTEFDNTASPGYYTNKEISVVMPTTAGSMTLTVNEKTRPVTGTGCEGTDSVANITVVDKSTLRWPGTIEVGSCTATDVVIPLTLAGSLKGRHEWDVTYEVLYTPYDNYPSGTITKVAGTTVRIPAANTLTINSTVFDAAGKYEVKVTNLSDRISRKSLDQAAVAAVAGVVGTGGATIPSAMYAIHVYPTPQTKKLEHVKNIL